MIVVSLNAQLNIDSATPAVYASPNLQGNALARSRPVSAQLNLLSAADMSAEESLSPETTSNTTAVAVDIFTDAFAANWQEKWDWSVFAATDGRPGVGSDNKALWITFTAPWSEYTLTLKDNNTLPENFTSIEFWLNGGRNGTRDLAITAIDQNNRRGVSVPLSLPPYQEYIFRIPLSDFEVPGPLKGFVVHQDGGSAKDQSIFYLDDIKLSTDPIGDGSSPTPTPTEPPQPTPVQPQPTPIDGERTECSPMLMGVNLPSLNAGYGADFATIELWDNYHTYNPDDTRMVMDNLVAYGANSIRWWVFLDGRGTPEFDENGFAIGLDAETLPSMADALVAAAERNITINFSLWSFEMLEVQGIAGGLLSSGGHGELYYNDAAFDSYVYNVLIPMANYPTADGYTIASHPNSMIEIINEPEWALNDTDQPVDIKFETSISTPQLQKFVARHAGVLHREGATMVGVGQASIKFIADIRSVKGAWKNIYADGLLQAYDPDGALDYYSPHYYDWMDGDGVFWNFNPFDYSKTQLGIDKPIIIGEIAATSASSELTKTLSSGYDGAWVWTYDGIDAKGSWDDAKLAFQQFTANYPNAMQDNCNR